MQCYQNNILLNILSGMIEALHEEIRTRTSGTNIKFTIIYPYMVDTGLCQKPIIR